jgi:CRP-like cAMP-binding protein
MSAKDYLMTLVPENEFLKALPPSDAELLSQAAEYVNFSQGQVLFQKGDVADSMFFIVEGAVEIIDDADNDHAILATLGEKAHFGEQGLLDVNEGKRTAGARAAEEARLVRISGELIRSMLRHQAQLVEKLEKVGSEQQDINRNERKLQLLLRIERSRSSLSMKTPRSPNLFSTLLIGVDTAREIIQLDEIIADFRNPVRAGDHLTLSGTLTGTPISFNTQVLEVKMVDGSNLYECSLPDRMIYQQQRTQFRLELGAASRAEAIVTKDERKYRGNIIDVSEGGVSFRLRKGVPIEVGDLIDHCELALQPDLSIRPKIEVMNVKPVVKAPNLQQFGVRFIGLASSDLATLKEFMRETERRKLRNSRM